MPLVVHAITALQGADFGELIVVVGHDEDSVRAVLPDGVTVVTNPGYRDGQATSLAAALHAVDDESEAAVILLADQPGVTADDVGALDRWLPRDAVADRAAMFTDGPGPALLSREIYAEAGHLHGDAGARVLMASHPDWVHEVRIDRPAPVDVDTPEDLP